MTAHRPAPRNLHGLPTLTEVIELSVPARAPASPDVPPAMAPVQAAAPADHGGVDVGQFASRIAGEVQRQADGMLEQRVREVVEPALAQAVDALLRDLQNEISAALSDLVARSVRQELERLQGHRNDGDAPLHLA